MNKIITTLLLALLPLAATAQKDSTAFRAYLYNEEYEVFLHIDLYDESIVVPDQELFGALPGYLARKGNPLCWLITSAEVKGNTARLAFVNDYGSEDLTATLTLQNDSVYILKQESGSPLKVPKNGKWLKLPKVLELKRK